MSRAIVITGMHRSGTSLVASLFERAGVNIGSSLLPPGPANPRGFFEDVDFQQFHERALHARGLNIIVREPLAFVPTDQELQRARELVEARLGHDLWGWKDPRTALFLPFWEELLDKPRFVFVYRHPLDVLCSLVRRRSFAVADLISALDAWHTYNRALLDFYVARRDRSVLVNIYGLLDEPETVAELLRERIGVAPAAEEIAAGYAHGELRRIATDAEADVHRALSEIRPLAGQLFGELEAAADLGDGARGGDGRAETSSADHSSADQLVSRELDRSSETTHHVLLALLVEQLDSSASRQFWHEFPTWARDLEIAVEWNRQQAEVASASEQTHEEFARKASEAELAELRARLRDTLDQLAAIRHDYTHLLTVDTRLRDEAGAANAREEQLRQELEAAARATQAKQEELNALLNTRVLRIARRYWGLKARKRGAPSSEAT